MATKIPLRCIETSEEVFDEILRVMAPRVITVEDIKPYVTGYKNKKRIMYDGKEYMIIQEYLFVHFARVNKEFEKQLKTMTITNWKQIKVRRTKSQSAWVDSIDGRKAYNYLINLVGKYYSKEEIHDQLVSHSAKYNPTEIQFHYTLGGMATNNIKKYTNCYKYDINGAHQDALIEIFPKAKDAITDLYNKRKTAEGKIYKKYMNYSVGYLKRAGYSETYNWIVQRTTKTLKDAIHQVGGRLLYANTDGFIVKDPDNLLKASTKLGEFKEEYKGSVYFYRDKNYCCYELETPSNPDDRVRGNIRNQVRHLLDCKNGIVPTYDIHIHSIIDHEGNKINLSEVENIKTEHKEVFVI